MRTAAFALTAGSAVFVLAGVFVTEVVSRWIEFSVFVGIPVGFVLGLVIAVLVYANTSDTTSGRCQRIATATGRLGVIVLLALIAAISILDLPVVTSLGIAFALGVLGAIGVLLRDTTP